MQIRYYLDTNDTYMREYAIKDNRFGYYLTEYQIKQIENDNRGNDKYYITSFMLKDYNLHEMIGSKIFKYTACPSEDTRYIVVNSEIMRTYEILSGYCKGDLELVFKACLSNYGVVDYLTKRKIEMPILYCNKFNLYRDMLNYNNLSQYERRISRRLKKYVCKDISGIIKNYILLPTFPLLKKH